MIKLNQSFLYGMGSGLILAAILFGASDLINAEKSSTNQMTAPSVENSAGQKPAEGKQTEGQKAQEIQKPAETQKPAEAPQTVKVTITDGMYANEVASLLLQSGVITDAEAFLNAAGDKVKNIRIGTYDLPVKGDYQQILKIITSS